MILTKRQFVAGLSAAALAGCKKKDPENVFRLPSGERFGMVGARPGNLRPVVFRFLSAIENSIAPWQPPHYGQLLIDRECVIVSVDVPCHGEDQRATERPGLSGWRDRVDRGQPIFAGFLERCKATLDYLVEQEITLPRVVATGISRGARAALEFAAADKRVGSVVCMAPVVNLLSLDEFEGCRVEPEPLHVDNLTDKAALIVVHEHDIRVATAPAIALYDALCGIGAYTDLDIVPGSGHYTKGREQAVANWIAKARY